MSVRRCSVRVSSGQLEDAAAQAVDMLGVDDQLVALAPWDPSKPALLTPDFEAFVAALLRRRRPEPSLTMRWRGFLAGVGMPLAPEEVVALMEP